MTGIMLGLAGLLAGAAAIAAMPKAQKQAVRSNKKR